MSRSTPSKSLRRTGISRLPFVVGASLISIALFAGIFAWLTSGVVANPEARLNVGLRLLKQGAAQEAMLRAASIKVDSLKPPSNQAKHHLILGAAALDDAEHAEYRQKAIKKAADSYDHLKKSDDIGFPRGYEGLGNFLLGKALFILFRWEEAVPPLESAIAEWPSGRTAALERLIDIELGAEKPNLDLLRKRLNQWRQFVGLTPEERELEIIKHIEVELAAGDIEKARQLVADFPTESSLRDKAKYLLARAELEHHAPVLQGSSSNLDELLQIMESVSRSSRADATTRRRGKYYCGLIQLKKQHPRIAVTIFSSLRQEAPKTVESAVATIEEMQALFDLGSPAEVAKTMRYFSDQFGEVAWYENQWIPVEKMRRRTNELGLLLLKSDAYPETVAFAEHLPPYSHRADRLKLLSEAYRKWALSLQGQAWNSEPLLDIRQAVNATRNAAKVNKQQHDLFSKAAKAYKELAISELRSPEYHDLVWAAIDCSQAAGELAQSNSLINEALVFESRDRQPRSILKMAENHFVMQEFDRSLAQLRRCIQQYPDHPLAYQARLNAARILNEQSDYEPAEAYLEENLYISELAPESPVWRESLFELGRLYYRKGEGQHAESMNLRDATLADQKTKGLERLEESHHQFLKSIECLQEWIKRYPEDDRRFDTLYSIGQAYQMAAQWNTYLLNENLLPSEDLIQSRKAEQRKLLDAARQVFKDIRDGINATKDWATLNPAQQRILRNSYFAEADLMFQAKNYVGALSAYRNIANRLLNEPESLEALAQAAECLRQLGRQDESQRVIAQAKDVLQQIPAQREPQFTAFTRFSRGEWSKHLDWMSRNSL